MEARWGRDAPDRAVLRGTYQAVEVLLLLLVEHLAGHRAERGREDGGEGGEKVLGNRLGAAQPGAHRRRHRCQPPALQRPSSRRPPGQTPFRA
eukprot:7978481-Pyramimonas_sp.AAC.1